MPRYARCDAEQDKRYPPSVYTDNRYEDRRPKSRSRYDFDSSGNGAVFLKVADRAPDDRDLHDPFIQFGGTSDIQICRG